MCMRSCIDIENLCFFCSPFFSSNIFYLFFPSERTRIVESFIQFFFLRFDFVIIFVRLLLLLFYYRYLLHFAALFTCEIWFESNHKVQTAIIRFGFIAIHFYLKTKNYSRLPYARSHVSVLKVCSMCVCVYHIFCFSESNLILTVSFHKYTSMFHAQCSMLWRWSDFER